MNWATRTLPATEIPYRVSDKKDYICDHIEPDANGTIHREDLEALIERVAGGSRIDDYLPDVLDRLGHVHHPDVYGLYIPTGRCGRITGSATTTPRSIANRTKR